MAIEAPAACIPLLDAVAVLEVPLKDAAKLDKPFLVVVIGFVNNPTEAAYILSALLFLPAAAVAVFIACPIRPIAPVIPANEANTGTATIGINPNATTINLIGAGAFANASIIGVNIFIMAFNIGAKAEPISIPKARTWFMKIFI